MPTLRGHHLLCTLNYSGSGYSAEFVDNLSHVVKQLNEGKPAKLVWGPDSICRAAPANGCHCHHPRITVRDVLAFVFASLATGKMLWPGRNVKLTKPMVTTLRRAFRTGWVRAGCVGCEWFGHCSATANAGWPKSKLLPGARP